MVSRGSVAVLLAFVAYVFGHTDVWTMVVGGAMCWRLCDERNGCRRLVYDSTNQCRFATEDVNESEPCGSRSCKSKDTCFKTSGWRLVKTITERKRKEDASVSDKRYLLLLPYNKNQETNGYRLNLANKKTDKFLCVWTNLRSAVYVQKTFKFLIVGKEEIIIANNLNDTGRRISIPSQYIFDIKADEDRDMMLLPDYKCNIFTGTLNGSNVKLLFKVDTATSCLVALNSEDNEIYIRMYRIIFIFNYEGKRVRTLAMSPGRIWSLIYVPSEKAVFYATREAVVKVSPDTNAIDTVIRKPRGWKGGFFSMTFHGKSLYLASHRYVPHVLVADFSKRFSAKIWKLKFTDVKAVGSTMFVLTLM